MKRSSGVTLIAILSLLGSLCTLLLAVFVAVAFFKMAPPAETPGHLVTAATKSIMIFSGLFVAAWAIWGISTSIGIFRLKNWARISILVFSALLTLSGFFGAALIAALPFPPAPNQALNPAFISRVHFVFIAYYLVMAMIGVWWLIFFNRKSVKQQFAAGSLASPDLNSSARPLSITIIAGYCLLSAALTAPMIFLHFPAALFSFVLTGTAALWAYGAYAAIFLYLGFGLLRLNPQARIVAIAYCLLGIASMLLFYLVPGYQSRLQRMMSANPWSSSQTLYLPAFTSFVIGFTVIFTLVLIAVALYFLLTRKPAFYKPAPLPT